MSLPKEELSLLIPLVVKIKKMEGDKQVDSFAQVRVVIRDPIKA